MFTSRFVRVYLFPGAVFQSVVVGGGYGTGREVVEFISRFGPVGGLLALVVAGCTFGLVMSLSYDLAQSYKIYDYRNFFKRLIGRFWIGYEFLFIITLLLVMAVIAAASGEILYDSFSIPKYIGIGVMLLAIMVLNFSGRDIVNKVLTFWALLAMLVILIYFIFTLATKFELILSAFQSDGIESGWVFSGFQFALYNTATIPALLFATTAIETQREARIAGTIGGILAILPGILFHISFMAGYPEIIEESLPTYWMMGQLAFLPLLYFYVVVLFGTIIQTGVGMLQGLNERLDAWSNEGRGEELKPITHAVIAGVAVLISAGLSSLGVIALIAEGYAALSWGLLCIYVLPLISVGIYRLTKLNT